MIGALYFEHRNKAIGLIVDEKNFRITDKLEIDISDDGKSDESVYISQLSPLISWLNKYPNMKFNYLGPKLSGITPNFKKGFQGTVYDPANDTRAFQQLIQPHLKNIKVCSPPSMSTISKNKDVIEILFHLESTEVELIKCVFIAMKASLDCKYSDLPSKLKQSAEYIAKKELIELMLPKSARKRLGLSTLKKAIESWNDPNPKYDQIKKALGQAAVKKKGEFISDLDLAQ